MLKPIGKSWVPGFRVEHRRGPAVDYPGQWVLVSVDLDALGRQLGRRAISSKGHKAQEASGAVVVKAE